MLIHSTFKATNCSWDVKKNVSEFSWA